MDVSRQRSCGSLIVFSAESACWRTPLRLRTGWIKRVLHAIAEEGAFEAVAAVGHFLEQRRDVGFLLGGAGLLSLGKGQGIRNLQVIGKEE